MTKRTRLGKGANVKPSKNAIDYAGAVRDWISSPHAPDEDLDLQLAELTQAHFEALFEACRLYEEALDKDCECDKAHEGGFCPSCGLIEKARRHWSRFAENTAKLNPDWTESLELELGHTKEHLEAWIWAYSVLVSIIEGHTGWETAKTKYPLHNNEEMLNFPAVSQVKGFRRSFEQIERRLHQAESLLSLVVWLQASKYRVLMHRHDGSFRAVDESVKRIWEDSTIEGLEKAIKEEPPQIYV